MVYRRLLQPFIDHLYLATAGCACIVISAAAADAADKTDSSLLHEAQTIFQPLPKDAGTAEFPVTKERTRLGRLLYFDPRLTIDANMS
jgi:cytochrome c peroxidase